MLPDELNIEIDLQEDVKIKIDDDVSDVKLTVDTPSDTIVLVPPDSVKITVETGEVELQIDNSPPDIDVILEKYPDVIVLPATGLTGPQGPEGDQGPPGPAGPAGPPETTYIFTQSIGITVWSITHNLGRYPSVTVIDSGGTEIIPDVTYVNSNQLILYFAYPTSGNAYLN